MRVSHACSRAHHIRQTPREAARRPSLLAGVPARRRPAARGPAHTHTHLAQTQPKHTNTHQQQEDNGEGEEYYDEEYYEEQEVDYSLPFPAEIPMDANTAALSKIPLPLFYPAVVALAAAAGLAGAAAGRGMPGEPAEGARPGAARGAAPVCGWALRQRRGRQQASKAGQQKGARPGG